MQLQENRHPSQNMSLMEILFGPRLTPQQVLAKTIDDLDKLARSLRRESQKLERTIQRDNVIIANLKDDNFQENEPQIRQLVKEQIRRRRAVGLYLARAGKAAETVVHMRLQNSEVAILGAILQGSRAIIRFGRSLPTQQQVQRLVAEYERAAMTQEFGRDSLKDAMEQASDALLDDDQDAELLSGDSVNAEVDREMLKLRDAAGLTDTADLERDLPNVLQRPGARRPNAIDTTRGGSGGE